MKEIIRKINKKGETIGGTELSGEGMIRIADNRTPVAIRDYVSGKGYGGVVDWDGENATVGGIAIKPMYIKDGKAYVDRAQADEAIADLEKRSGVRNSFDAENNREKKYGDDEKTLTDNIANRREFAYSPDDDPSFKAYKDQQERVAEDAFRRVLNDNNASVSTATGAVLSEAMAAQYEALSKIADKVPELYMDAFDRYERTGESMRSDLSAIAKVADGYFERLYKSNDAAYENLSDATEAEREDKQRWHDNQRDLENDYYDNRQKQVDIDKGEKELMYLDEELQSEINENNADTESQAVENAIMRGFFTSSDEKLLPWLSKYRNGDGTYSISPTLASVAYEYEKAHAKERGKINAKLGL